MRRLTRVLWITVITLVITLALLISALRLLLPQLNDYRPWLLTQIEQRFGTPWQVAYLSGSWENFGPTLEMRQIQATLPQSDLQIDRITLALDIWQSLLHRRWQFRDLTFYQAQLDLHQPLGSGIEQGSSLTARRIQDLFLKQFDYFTVRNSRVRFITPAGETAKLDIPQLTWLNTPARHRAEGEVSLSSLNGQHGVVQLRLDLRDEQGLLNNGSLYLQGDNIDLKPWFTHWLRNNVGLHSAQFSLASWITLKRGGVERIDLLLPQGAVTWSELHAAPSTPVSEHRLEADNLMLSLTRQQAGWQLDVPALTLKTDDQAWPPAAWLSARLLQQETTHSARLPSWAKGETLRLRAGHLQLEAIAPLLQLFSFLDPPAEHTDATTSATTAKNSSPLMLLHPRGRIETLAVDIPLQQPQQSHFAARWQHVGWQPVGEDIPGIDHFSGMVAGSLQSAQLRLALTNSRLRYAGMFAQPLQISQASGVIAWQHQDDGWSLSAQQLDIKTPFVWFQGDMAYQQPIQSEPWLGIIAGIRLTDAAEAKRYFPYRLMGPHLVEYLSRALQGGHVDNASLLFDGNPQLFPYHDREGHFQVYVPLRDATFAFQPHWPALKNLDMNLDFTNNGLSMYAPALYLGKVIGRHVQATIPNYDDERLLIHADLTGEGSDIHDYFNQTPLAHSVGKALEEVSLRGPVSGRLHLDIPLDEGETVASGDITLRHNELYLAPLSTQLTDVNGLFRFHNGILDSDPLTAQWFGQPVTLHFSTQESRQAYQVNVGLQGEWLPANVEGIPPAIAAKLAGTANLQGQVNVSLPHTGGAHYNVELQGDLKSVSSTLPLPLSKTANSALAVKLNANGDLNGLTLIGHLGTEYAFNSQWHLGKQQVVLRRALLDNLGGETPPLPKDDSVNLNVPALDIDSWLALTRDKGNRGNLEAMIPNRLRLNTPQLMAAGQTWRQLQLTLERQAENLTISAKGKEIDGRLILSPHYPWQSEIAYLYYNPLWLSAEKAAGKTASVPPQSTEITFSNWPALRFRCEACWLFGQRVGHIEADITPNGDRLVLEHGLVDSGQGRLTATGYWRHQEQQDRVALKGGLSGTQIDTAAGLFGVTTPLQLAPFDSRFEVNWQGSPWAPQLSTLNGSLDVHLGRGEIAELGGRGGQLLRLVSFDALMRKLRLDFSDTFGQSFYFDAIRGTGQIRNGIMTTQDLLIDGLSANITLRGSVDLVRRQIDMEAAIAPALSATVSVATAFAVNPLAGVAVFAASRVLGPLWSQFSLIRYQITGEIDQPSVHEVLRQMRPEEKTP